MRAFGLAAGVLVVLVVAGIAAYRLVLARAFVTAGRGVIDRVEVVTVTRVGQVESTVNYKGMPVQAGPGNKYVLIECRINAPVDKVDPDDFQLVKKKSARLGEEENLGSNRDRDYFYWSFLDASGQTLVESPTSSGPFMVRLAFKVPIDANTGYLFYWGLYWGPLKLDVV